MNIDLVKAWIHDLETTTEKQCIGWLHDVVDGGYCCLGRACVVAGLQETENGTFWTDDGSSDKVMPRGSHRQFGLANQGGDIQGGELFHQDHGVVCLSRLNDLGCTFKDIAAILRYALLKEDVKLPQGVRWIPNP